MKKLYWPTLFLLFTLISHESLAQFPLGRQKAKLSGVRVYLGGHDDAYANLSAKGLYSMLKPGQQVDFNLNEYYQADSYAALMTGGTLGINLIFNPRNTDGSVRTNREIRIGADLGLDREVMIDMQARNTGGRADNIALCVLENSFNLEAAYLFKAPISQALEVYAGPGANLGGTFGNRFLFIGDPSDTGDRKARNSNYLRAYAIAGATLGANKFFFQLEGTAGAGTQIVHDGKANFLGTYGLRIGVGYRW